MSEFTHLANVFQDLTPSDFRLASNLVAIICNQLLLKSHYLDGHLCFDLTKASDSAQDILHSNTVETGALSDSPTMPITILLLIIPALINNLAKKANQTK